MDRCQKCNGQLRFSRALKLLECMECSSLFDPALSMVFGETRSQESTENRPEAVLHVTEETKGVAQTKVNHTLSSKQRIYNIPAELEVLNEGSEGLEYRLPKKASAGCFMLCFTLFWNGFMLVWYTIAISQQQWAMAAFGVLHAMVGVYLIVATLAQLLNQQMLKVDQNGVFVNNRPIPLGNKSLKRLDVVQIILLDQGSSFSLGALLRSGATLTLVLNLEYDVARYLEQHIEDFWQIIDDPTADVAYAPSATDDYDDYDDHDDFDDF